MLITYINISLIKKDVIVMEEQETRVCTCCDEEKSVDNFYRQSYKHTVNYRNWCKKCYSAHECKRYHDKKKAVQE